MGIEAGALLPLAVVVVAMNFDKPKSFVQGGQCQSPNEAGKGLLLGWCSGVLWEPKLIEATNVADTNGIFVVAFAMGSYLVLWATDFNCSIKVYHVVVANIFKAILLVPAANIAGLDVFVLARSGTMDDDVIKESHGKNVCLGFA